MATKTRLVLGLCHGYRLTWPDGESEVWRPVRLAGGWALARSHKEEAIRLHPLCEVTLGPDVAVELIPPCVTARRRSTRLAWYVDPAVTITREAA